MNTHMKGLSVTLSPAWLRESMILLVLCSLSAAIGVTAWTDQDRLLSLAVLLFVPFLIFKAKNRFGAFLIAFTYYATATRAVPGIICIFFPNQPMLSSVFLWCLHGSLLALPWALGYAHLSASARRKTIGVVLTIIFLTIPPIGLFHWGSPMMSAGLLFPGWQWLGLLLTLGLIIFLILSSGRSRWVHVGIAITLILAVIANIRYDEPTPPKNWHAISLQFGKGLSLWSDEMQARREFLVDTAMDKLDAGAEVVIFPEAITGSSNRPQSELWHPVYIKAKRLGATVLVGEETWDKKRTAFKNGLLGFGQATEEGAVVVSSRVPMPVGDWKFGLEPAAETNIFGNDVLEFHGKQVSFSICYEDFLLWTHRGLLAGQADLLVSISNQWPSSGTSAEMAQDISRVSVARLGGVALLTAKNH